MFITPAVHEVKVGMRCPARVLAYGADAISLELDLSTLASGLPLARPALLMLSKSFSRSRTGLYVGSMEVVLTEVDPKHGYLVVALPADPAWLAWNNGTVRQLARRIFETGETVLLPVLADALEDAGCSDRAVLARCRHPEGTDLKWLITLLTTQE